MTTFNIGDKVIVRNYDDNHNNNIIRPFIGKTVTVSYADGSFIGLKEIPAGPLGRCGWATSRFEKAPAPKPFKKGDLVVMNEDAAINKRPPTHYSKLYGRAFQIADTVGSGAGQMIELIGEDDTGLIYAERFKLAPFNPWKLTFDAPVVAPYAPPALATWVIILREKGKLDPAIEPREYTSEAQAIKVAKKMAEAYTGEFIVFKSIAAAIVPAAVKPTVSVSTFA